jgi:hypothetical protein
MSYAAAISTRPANYAIIRRVEEGHTTQRASRSEDRLLAERVVAREPGAMEAVYDRYAGPCFGYLLSALGERGAAEDVPGLPRGLATRRDL